jgi:hypothetical protein
VISRNNKLKSSNVTVLKSLEVLIEDPVPIVLVLTSKTVFDEIPLAEGHHRFLLMWRLTSQETSAP